MTSDAEEWNVRKLTHEQARMEQLLYWQSKSVAERLAAAAALTRRMYKLRGIDLDEQETDWNPRWVSRRNGLERPIGSRKTDR